MRLRRRKTNGDFLDTVEQIVSAFNRSYGIKPEVRETNFGYSITGDGSVWICIYEPIHNELPEICVKFDGSMNENPIDFGTDLDVFFDWLYDYFE